MIKFIVFCTKFVVATIIALLLTSCNSKFDFGDGIDGNGNVTTEKRTVTGDFTKIEASRGLTVEVEQAKSYFIEVEADQNLQQHITTKVENGILYVTADENIDQAESRTIRVKMPKIDGLETTSGADIVGKNTFLGTDLKIRTSSGSEIEVTAEIDAIDCESTSGSSIKISGKALRLATASSSGSTINAEDLMANEVTSESTSGSSSDVHPIVVLNAKASSGSSINYVKNPEKINKEETSGGSVSQE